MSGSRLTFPYALDRLVVYHFLMGDPYTPEGEFDDGFGSILTSEDRALRYEGDAVMSFDTGGSLVINLNTMSLPQTIRLANYVLALINVPADEYLMRSPYLDHEPVPYFEYTYRGEIIRTNDPLVLVGPMVIQAWRVSQRANK